MIIASVYNISEISATEGGPLIRDDDPAFLERVR
jgi:hypothetical protein